MVRNRTHTVKSNNDDAVTVSVFSVGTSLLASLRRAESEINAQYNIGLRIAAYNCGAPFNEADWTAAERDIASSEVVFVIHVTEGENAERIAGALDRHRERNNAVIAFNCMPDLMRRSRMGNLDFSTLMKSGRAGAKTESEGSGMARKLATWMSEFVKRQRSRGGDPGKKQSRRSNTDQYLRLIGRLPGILRFVPAAGRLADVKRYLFLFCYFLQPTPNNIRSMILYALNHYAGDRHHRLRTEPPESMPTVAIYHPDAPMLFERYEGYRKWYEGRRGLPLDSKQTIGLLLMRPQIVSDARQHYDGLIRAIESEGLHVIPAISTFMDNRDACDRFFVDSSIESSSDRAGEHGARTNRTPRVSQIVSLTGFSFVGGPAMNDSEAAVEFMKELNVPFRSMVSLDVQTIDDWSRSKPGLNPIQTAMQVAIPEIDGAGEPLIFGGLLQGGHKPVALEERCRKIARRLARWNRLRITPADELKLALLVFCFPPNKGNVGTAADLDVFPSAWEILGQLREQGYRVDLPTSADNLRELVLEGNSSEFGTVANIAYRMSVDEYRRLCPYVNDIEREWGKAPGTINSNGREILILGRQLGNIFVGVQPTFGYEGDPMKLLAAESGAPHHGFMGLYTYLEKVYGADAVVHVGTHGALEFMPGKQVGLSERCWPDRLIGELPNVYIYSVNNPSEGTIARRRSYAELISYLTPPIENAGLYKEFAAMKDLLAAYRQSDTEVDRNRLFAAIEEKAALLNL